ncbi:Hypothetical predicted protein [Podarcis lilfordi]|uniref:Uncharacterized protein n=1 Tax=Podarcis lilfordi TaxID=74358 RepID=A0AA35JTW9_9SAUR|nr:Hypothetical predicted protein [Podarcis lilfordi]
MGVGDFFRLRATFPSGQPSVGHMPVVSGARETNAGQGKDQKGLPSSEIPPAERHTVAEEATRAPGAACPGAAQAVHMGGAHHRASGVCLPPPTQPPYSREAVGLRRRSRRTQATASLPETRRRCKKQ